MLVARKGATIRGARDLVGKKIAIDALKGQDPTLTAKFRNAIQAASVWADKKENRRASAAILAKYAPIDAGVMRTMTRAYYAKRLVPGLAQPWIDLYAEFGVIPESFPAIQLVK